MIDYQPLYNTLLDAKADNWVELLPGQLASAFATSKHGTLSQWQNAIENLPPLTTAHRLLDADDVQIGHSTDLPEADLLALEQQLKTLHPWRKGPYNLFGIKIECFGGSMGGLLARELAETNVGGIRLMIRSADCGVG